MCYIIFFLFIIMSYCKSESITLSNSHTISESLSQCVVRIAEHYFPKNESILVALDMMTSNTLYVYFSEYITAALSKDAQWTLYVKDRRKPQNGFDINGFYQNYIIEMENEEELSNILKYAKTSLKWNPHAQFLIIATSNIYDTQELSNQVSNILLREDINHGIYLLSDFRERSTFHIYIWSPYKNDNCKIDSSNMKSNVNCTFGKISKNEDILKHESVSYRSNGCVIRIKAIVWPPYVIKAKEASALREKNELYGLEINIINMISSVLNINISYRYTELQDWGRSFLNRTITGALVDLEENKADLLLGAFTTTLSRYILFDNSVAYLEEDLICCVPYELIVDNWSIIVGTFTVGCWCLIICIYFLLAVLIWLGSVFNDSEYNAFKKLSNSVLKCFSILFGLPVNTLPRTSTVRFLTFLLIALGMCFISVYNTVMVSLLETPRAEQKIRTFKDIYKFNLKTYFPPNTIRYFEMYDYSDENNDVKLIREHWRDCYNMSECLDYVTKDRDSSVCLSRSYKDYVFQKYVSERNEPLLHCFQKEIITYPLNLVMKKGFPLCTKINQVLSKIITAGFIDRWKKDMFIERFSNTSIINSESSNDDVIGILTFLNLKPVFVLLVIFEAAAALVFVIEIFYPSLITMFITLTEHLSE